MRALQLAASRSLLVSPRSARLVSAALLIVALFALGTGCTVTYPEGVIACGDDAQCPSGFICREMRCFSTPGASDAAVDASLPDDAGTDAGADAAPIDLGCPATGPTNATCPWYFGRPHAVPSLHPSTTGLFSAVLTADGETIYVASWNTVDDLPIYEASRGSSAERFGALVATLGSANVGVRPSVLSMTEDGLEMFAQVVDARTDVQTTIVRYQRGSLVSEFGPPQAIGAVDRVLGATHPAITGDGLELFFTSPGDNRVYRTWRPTREMPFERAESAGLPAGFIYPRVTPDGLGIFVGTPAQYATRPNRTSAFGVPAPLLNADALGGFALPTYVPATRELWYATGLDSMRAPWSATTYALWRVQVCRDGPCAPEPSATDCPKPRERSVDGLHCYFAQLAVASIGAARDQCGLLGAQFALATVHSDEELALVACAASDGTAWLAGERTDTSSPFVWTTREPAVFELQPWAPGEPNTSPASRYLAVSGTTFAAVSSTANLPSICEQSVWPYW